MNPFLRKIIMQLAEKLIKSTYKAYVNVKNQHGAKNITLFDQFKEHLKTNPEAKMSTEEAIRILNLEPNSKSVLYLIEQVI
jgi:hypothetical protein